MTAAVILIRGGDGGDAWEKSGDVGVESLVCVLVLWDLSTYEHIISDNDMSLNAI